VTSKALCSVCRSVHPSLASSRLFSFALFNFDCFLYFDEQKVMGVERLILRSLRDKGQNAFLNVIQAVCSITPAALHLYSLLSIVFGFLVAA
jgi:hypothetical protein